MADLVLLDNLERLEIGDCKDQLDHLASLEDLDQLDHVEPLDKLECLDHQDYLDLRETLVRGNMKNLALYFSHHDNFGS